MTDRAGVLLDVAGVDRLVAALSGRGYRTVGPVASGGAIVPGPIEQASDLPRGCHDEQAPGHYRLARDDDPSLFAWAVGPSSWKAEFFPARSVVWRGSGTGEEVTLTPVRDESPPVAVIGARPCEVAALQVLDRVFDAPRCPDASYGARRSAAFVVVAECSRPAATCFCASMGTGPGVAGGFDLALTELVDESGQRFLVRAGSGLGEEVLTEVGGEPAPAGAWSDRMELLETAVASMARALDTDGLADLLARNLDHPRWDEVADRCLACGNCTLVCPTCFCSAFEDVSDLSGATERHRRWDSCFDLAYSEVHGGPVRSSVRSRYRQWATHKLSTWFDQFQMSGCVGCGRCITWCPVGIDITEEAAAIRRSDGAGSRGAVQQ